MWPCEHESVAAVSELLSLPPHSVFVQNLRHSKRAQASDIVRGHMLGVRPLERRLEHLWVVVDVDRESRRRVGSANCFSTVTQSEHVPKDGRMRGKKRLARVHFLARRLTDERQVVVRAGDVDGGGILGVIARVWSLSLACWRGHSVRKKWTDRLRLRSRPRECAPRFS